MNATSDRCTNTEIKIIVCSNTQLKVSAILLLVVAIITTTQVINAIVTQTLMVETSQVAAVVLWRKDEKPLALNETSTKASVTTASYNSLPEPVKMPVDLTPDKGFDWPAVNSICPVNVDRKVKALVIIVHSARENIQNRNIIRKTWGSLKFFRKWTLSTVFLLGGKKITEDKELTVRITEEATSYGDIALKTSFIDTYHNLSEKHTMGYEWVTKFCSHANAVVKSDDDFVIDVFKLIDWLAKTRLDGYFCRLYGKNQPSRDPESKWYVPTNDYPHKTFPPFCSGGAYVVSTAVIAKVLRNLPAVKKIWLDDVYVTGLGVQKANMQDITKPRIKHHDRSQEYMYYHWDLLTGMDLIRDWAKSNLKTAPWSFILVEHSPDYVNDFELIWKKLVNLHKYPVYSFKT